MSNLNNNTTKLEALLTKVNELPDAGSGLDTSDATATAEEIFAGETAYTADGKITGTFSIDSELTAQDNLISQISTLVATKATPSGIDTNDATATANDILSDKTAYVKGEKVTGTIPSKAAATYIPSTSNQIIDSGTYLTGTQTIKGDTNLKAANIAPGVSIFGVTGTYASDATATTDEIFSGETAYTTNGKITGTFTIDSELTEQNDLISQISTLVATKANPQGGTDTSDATATAADILSGKTAYVDGEKVTGTITTKTSSNLIASGATVTVPAGYYASQATKSVATATQATPSVSIDANGKITASATQTAGYVSAGTKTGTKQMTTKAATTYTPSTSNQTIASGTYLTGVQTIKGDANLKAANIASGVSIFGVTGTHSGTEDLDTELTTQENLISQLSTILDNKASGGGGGNSFPYTITVTCNISALEYSIFYDYENTKIAIMTNLGTVGIPTPTITGGQVFASMGNGTYNVYIITSITDNVVLDLYFNTSAYD